MIKTMFEKISAGIDVLLLYAAFSKSYLKQYPIFLGIPYCMLYFIYSEYPDFPSSDCWETEFQGVSRSLSGLLTHLYFLAESIYDGPIVKCPPQGPLMKVWSPGDDAVLEGGGTFRSWGPAGWSRMLGSVLEGYLDLALPLLLLCSLPWGKQLCSNTPFCHGVLPHRDLKSIETAKSGQKPRNHGSFWNFPPLK